jgi:hypothetical protein
MTDEQINAAIAEACGRKRRPNGDWYPDNGSTVGSQAIRDYCNCLNAMHEAEQYLWRKDYYMRYDYVDELGKLQNPHNWQRMEASDMLDVTARERAEAFLRTLGKWHQSGDATEMVKEAQK